MAIKSIYPVGLDTAETLEIGPMLELWNMECYMVGG